MRHAHQLFHSLQSLPSSQHPQRLPSLGYPSIYFLLVKLVKHFCWMLPSYLQWPCHTYLALGGDKGTKLRIHLTRNGISFLRLGLWGGNLRILWGERHLPANARVVRAQLDAWVSVGRGLLSRGSPVLWCPEGDSNSHGLAATTPSK
jgi:hypothetical protein